MTELLDFLNINIFRKPVGDLRHPKTLVLNFHLKLCPYRNLIESSFHKIFQNFWTRSLSIMQLSRYTPIFTFLNTSYLENTLLKTSEIFYGNYSRWDLYMGKVSDQNSKLRFLDAWRPPQASWKCLYLKNLIAQPYLNSNPNPFRVFTRPLCSIYGQKITEIWGAHLERFPRQSVSSNLSHRVELISIHPQLITSYWFDWLRFIQRDKFELCPIFFFVIS
jgi:hypothetical protein